MNCLPFRNIRFVDGTLTADVADKSMTFERPCDAAALCGPGVFVFNDGSFTFSPCAERVITLAENANSIIPLRGEFNDFIMFAVFDGLSFSVAALARKSTTLTVRVEDVWEKLPLEKRRYSYVCEVTSSTVQNDEEKKFTIAPDARIFIDLNDFDGFIMTFTPEDRSRD